MSSNIPSTDIALKDFFSDNNVYASVFNDFLFKEELINPDELEPIDTAYQENVIAKAKPEKIYRYRDCLRRTKYGHLLIVGIEKVPYTMELQMLASMRLRTLQ